MIKTEPRPQARGATYYRVVALASLGTFSLVLLARDLETWTILTVLAIGSLAILIREGKVHLLFLLALSVCLSLEPNRHRMFFAAGSFFRIGDLIVCSAVLAYIQSYGRLHSLRTCVFPVMAPAPGKKKKSGGHTSKAITAPRTRPASQPPLANRAEHVVAPAEIGWLVCTVPFWAGLAQIGWNFLPREAGNPGIRPPIWRAIVFAWIAGATLLASSSVLDYLARCRMTPLEAEIYLQDFLWRETRGEQRRLNRWLAWARLGRDRRNRYLKAFIALLMVLAMLSAFLYYLSFTIE